MTKYVYLFKEGNKDMRDLLGGKGANLAEMTNMGLPVPNGFTITTEACTKYYKDNGIINQKIETEILDTINKLEIETGKKIGNKYKYFEKSLKRNFEKEESRPDEIYGEQEIKELLDMFEGRW